VSLAPNNEAGDSSPPTTRNLGCNTPASHPIGAQNTGEDNATTFDVAQARCASPDIVATLILAPLNIPNITKSQHVQSLPQTIRNKMSTNTPPTTFALRSIPADWYTTSSTTNNSDPAREAYTSAVKLFKQNLTSDDCKRIWLDSKTDMQAVQEAVNDAKEKYEERASAKARKWLTRLSERIMHYGKVMDTLANYNPEYCALAWGTMKFLLMVSLF
jgi:hypothetical protein